MKKYILSLLALAVILTGCITKSPQNLTPIPPLPPMSQASTPPLPPMPVARKLMAVRAMATAPAGAIFYDPFDSGAATPWTFYQGTRLFTNGILRLTVANNAGMYAYVRTNWTNISVSADIKLGATSWGAAVGLRYNPTNGANYQLWIYGSGRLTIEKYSNWYNTWTQVAGTTIAAPGITTNNLKLAMTNNILTAYYNGTQRLTYTDTLSPLMNGGAADLGIWGGNAACTADFDNVTVYNLSVTNVPTTNPPVLVVGLTNTMALKGQNKTLTVTATGTALTYLWQTSSGQVVGTNTYTITNVQSARSYGVIITNVLGKVSSSAYVSMGTTNILTNCVSTPVKTSVTLAWCPSPPTTNNAIAGYKVYYGNGAVTNWSPDVYATNQPPCPGVIVQQGTNWSRTYTNMVEAGTNLTATVSNLVSAVTYYFAATAYDTNGLESDYSSEVSTTIPSPLMPKPPTNVVLSITAIGGGQIQLQSKICPNALSTVLYQTALLKPWFIAASNVVADVYGNFIYIETPTNAVRFYKVLLQ